LKTRNAFPQRRRERFVGRSCRCDAPKEIKVRHIGNCMKADPAYGEGVAKALGI